jgi:hypothetical protein
VGDNEENGVLRAVKRQEQFGRTICRFGVEVARGLVAKYHLRLANQRAGDGDALLLAAR